MKCNYLFLLLAAALLSVVIGCKQAHQPVTNGLELVFEDSVYELTGVAKQAGGKLLVNYPRWSTTYKYAVAEVSGVDESAAYPDEFTNQWTPPEPGNNKWVCVQSVYADDNNNIWVLDPAAPFLKTIQDNGPKLVKMGEKGTAFQKTYSFTNILPDTAYVNDVRIDVVKQYAYLTESKGGGIIVLNLSSGDMRRVLAGHYSVISDPAYKFMIDGHELMKDGKPAKFNSDGIALSPDGVWLYYKPLSDDKLYRIETIYLRDAGLTDSALAKHVEDLGHFVTTDGMIFDKSGNLYMGDLQRSRIVRVDKNLNMTVVVQDDRLIWPDSYSIANGYLYISCSQIQKQPEYNNGVNKRISPYTVYKIKI